MFIPKNTVTEELFCNGSVKYYSQPVGVVVAVTEELAEKAADLVNVTYSPGKHKPLLTIRQILAAKATDKIFEDSRIKATRRGNVQSFGYISRHFQNDSHLELLCIL